MRPPLDRRSLLLASDRQDRWALRALLEAPLFDGWEVREADSIERARFVLQMEPCDVLLLDSALYRGGDPDAVAWLAAQRQAPVLLLSEPEAGVVVSALRNGASQWLARDLALTQPEILAATLQQVARVGEMHHRERATGAALHDCRRQVSRLVSLLWESVPGDGRRSWFPQRHMLERLEEEVARSTRHGETLTVVLGELHAGDGSAPGASRELASWTVEKVTEGKRRCDVAGQYGPTGFMLLLPNTSDEGAVQCCRRIQVRLEQAAPGNGLPALHAAFGVVSLSADVTTVKGLLSRAEERLERAKTSAANAANA